MNIQQGFSIQTIITYGAAIALIINAINVCFWEGHIFQRIGDYMETKFPNLWKPIAGCIICQSPWWGTLLCFVFGWPFLSVIIAMGINVLVVRFEPKEEITVKNEY